MKWGLVTREISREMGNLIQHKGFPALLHNNTSEKDFEKCEHLREQKHDSRWKGGSLQKAPPRVWEN